MQVGDEIQLRVKIGKRWAKGTVARVKKVLPDNQYVITTIPERTTLVIHEDVIGGKCLKGTPVERAVDKVRKERGME